MCYYKHVLYFSKEKSRKKRLRQQVDLSGRLTAEEKARRLLRAFPHWKPILLTCITVAKERGEESKNTKYSGRFAGAWVIQSLRVDGIPPPSNLRTIATIGLIKLVSTSRSGNRAYYTIPDVAGITKALKEFHD